MIKTKTSEMFLSIMSILHDKLPCSNSFFRMRTQFRQKLGSGNLSAQPMALIASPALVKKKSFNSSKGGGLAEKNCVNWMDSSDEDEDDGGARRAAGAPQIGIAPLE